VTSVGPRRLAYSLPVRDPTPLKLAVLGASGRTGRLLVEQALARGHEVRVLVRHPAKLGDLRSRVSVVEGDATDPEAVERLVTGSNAVLSALGHAAGSPPDLQTTAIRHALAAMNRHTIKRLVSLTGAGVRDPHDRPGLVGLLFAIALKVFAKTVHEDAVRHSELIRSSEVEWTIVRAPRLRDGPGGRDIKVGYAGGGPGTQIDRADVARFMLEQLRDAAWIRKAPMIGN
jgi:putative NADH-flavin reductase